MISLLVPLQLVSEANQAEHWTRRARRRKAQRMMVCLALRALHVVVPKPPLVVSLCRLSPRQLDTDNLSSAFKSVRDEIALWLGVDDRSASVQYRYSQDSYKTLSPRHQQESKHWIHIQIGEIDVS
jgi:hypothetical protein